MDFLLIFGLIGLVVVILVVVADRHPGSGADLVGLSSRHSYEAEANIEAEEVSEMVRAQNEYRRRRGESALTDRDLKRWVSEDEDARRRGRRVQELEEEFEAAPEPEGEAGAEPPPPGASSSGEPGRRRGGGPSDRPDSDEPPLDTFPGGWRER